jgi:hypothetical protein
MVLLNDLSDRIEQTGKHQSRRNSLAAEKSVDQRKEFAAGRCMHSPCEFLNHNQTALEYAGRLRGFLFVRIKVKIPPDAV